MQLVLWPRLKLPTCILICFSLVVSARTQSSKQTIWFKIFLKLTTKFGLWHKLIQKLNVDSYQINIKPTVISSKNLYSSFYSRVLMSALNPSIQIGISTSAISVVKCTDSHSPTKTKTLTPHLMTGNKCNSEDGTCLNQSPKDIQMIQHYVEVRPNMTIILEEKLFYKKKK